MIDKIKKEKFIELRASGLSFDKICEEIKVSKPTLLKWNKELYQEISNLEYLEAKSIVDQFNISRNKKIETLTKKLTEVYSVLEEFDVKTLSIKDLIAFRNFLESQLKETKKDIMYYTGETEEISWEDFNPMKSEIKDITIPLE